MVSDNRSPEEQLKAWRDATQVFLVEEVPGVPENERWFASGGPLSYPYPHFSTRAEGEKWLREHGLPNFTVEHFEP